MTIDPRLINPLLDRPQAFDFFQAVQLLEQLRPERAPVGAFADPRDEVVHFEAATGVAFPASAVQQLEDPTDAPAKMTVNFFGMTGPKGVLPLDYSLYVANRGRAGDFALKSFLGIFEHRIVSLFYRAWTKSHAAVGFGRSKEQTARENASEGANQDWLTELLLSIVGMRTEGLQGRLPLPDEALLYYAGLLSMPSRPATALEQLVADYFDVPCEVEQFVGAWYPLTIDTQTALGEEMGSLGGGAVAGDEVWDQQGRVRVRIGPLTRQRYDEFLPGGESHEALRALTRFFGNDQFDFEIQLVLARDEAPACQIDADAAPLPLGWCTWLHTAPLGRDPEDAVFTL
ncbi:MAG TPA: type VI secretion system baseplate subunit TssG [Gemmatimonadaceae bacterium]